MSKRTEPRPKRQYMEAAQRRQQLIEVALGLFASRGFRGTTTRQIATAAGVSEGVLFKHFPSKQDLFRAILAAHLTQIEPTVLDWEAARREDPRVFLKTVLSLLLSAFVAECPPINRLLSYAALEEPELADLFVQSYVMAWREHMVRYFGDLQARGILRRDLPAELLTTCFHGPLASIDHQINLFKRQVHGLEDLDTLTDRLVGTLFDGIRTRE